MLRRPDDLSGISETLVRLAVEGRVAAEGVVAPWLEAIGVGDVLDGNLFVREEWVFSALSAKNARDLLRRTAFRDAKYRIHLDFQLARVLTKMARDNRMAKVEEYLMTKLSRFAPRFAWLLDHLGDTANSNGWDVVEARYLSRSEAKSLHNWDKVLFGDVLGGVEQRFPLIADIYGVRAGDPVCVRCSRCGLSPDLAKLATEAVSAGAERQGIVIAPEEESALLMLLAKTALPIRIWRSPIGASRAACVGPVLLLVDEPFRGGLREQCSVAGDLARELAASKAVEVRASQPPLDIWAIQEGGGRTGAFPGANVFETPSAVTSLFAPSQPDYLRKLSDHPLFGLLFQFFVIESFDRELGEDSLTVLRVGQAEKPERVDVYYRPTEEDKPHQLLGSIDDVLISTAEHLGMYTPPKLWEDCPYRLWTQALLALTEAKVIAFQSGEFVLDKAVFDDCHNRDHMQRVLRRGQKIRDRIHEALRAQYEAKAGSVEARV